MVTTMASELLVPKKRAEILDTLLHARKDLYLENEAIYFDESKPIGWTRSGNEVNLGSCNHLCDLC